MALTTVATWSRTVPQTPVAGAGAGLGGPPPRGGRGAGVVVIFGGGGAPLSERAAEAGAPGPPVVRPAPAALAPEPGVPPPRVQAGDPGGQLNHDEPDQLAREKVREGGEAGEVRVGVELDGSVGRQDVPHPLGDADVGEERVESLAGEDLDPVAHA